MQPLQNSKSFRNFAKHLFLVSRTYRERNKAKEDVDQHLHRMRKSVIRMSLTYSEIDRLKQKIANLVSLERKFSKYFKPEDRETEGLKNRISELEQELKKAVTGAVEKTVEETIEEQVQKALRQRWR